MTEAQEILKDDRSLRDLVMSLPRRKEMAFGEIRCEEWQETYIRFESGEVAEVSTKERTGGFVRALVEGVWGGVSFNSFNVSEGWNPFEAAVSLRRGKEGGSVELTPLEAIEDFVSLNPAFDPRLVPLSKKKEICRAFDAHLRGGPVIVSSTAEYFDTWVRKRIMNSEGTYVVKETASAGMLLMVVATNGAEVRVLHRSITSQTGTNGLWHQEGAVKELVQSAEESLRAVSPEAGLFPVVLDPHLTGMLVHEAFGHFCEADVVQENPEIAQVLEIDRPIGVAELDVVDDGTILGQVGCERYDDEGVPTQKTYLIRGGAFQGWLHSRETAARLATKPTGNGRAANFRFPPIPRMRCTYIEPRDYEIDRMIRELEDGYYLQGYGGGETSLETFTLTARQGFRIRGGEVCERVKDPVLVGNVFETFTNIDAIGNDLELYGSVGREGCSKGEQLGVPVSMGGPHIRVKEMLVGGR